MMHIITKVAIAAAIPAVAAVGISCLAMKAPRPETAQLLYALASTVLVVGILVGVVVWVGHNIQKGLMKIAGESDEAKVRMLMHAAMRENADIVFGPKEL